MVIFEHFGEQNPAGSRLHGFPCGMRHHQRVEHLDCPHDGDGRTEKSVLDGDVPILVEPDDHGGNPGRGNQEPCGKVPPLFLHVGTG